MDDVAIAVWAWAITHTLIYLHTIKVHKADYVGVKKRAERAEDVAKQWKEAFRIAEMKGHNKGYSEAIISIIIALRDGKVSAWVKKAEEFLSKPEPEKHNG